MQKGAVWRDERNSPEAVQAQHEFATRMLTVKTAPGTFYEDGLLCKSPSFSELGDFSDEIPSSLDEAATTPSKLKQNKTRKAKSKPRVCKIKSSLTQLECKPKNPSRHLQTGSSSKSIPPKTPKSQALQERLARVKVKSKTLQTAVQQPHEESPLLTED